jgi:hypothetical protein
MGGGGLGGGGGFFSVEDDAAAKPGASLWQFDGGGDTSRGNLGAARTSLDELVSAITETINPDEWADMGGNSTIARLGNSLLITASAESHQQIEGMLQLFRERWGSLRTISLRAYWLWLTDEQLAGALSQDVAEGTEHAEPFGVVADAAWQRLLSTAAEAANRQGYRAAITCYNGQTVHTLAGGQQLTVSGMTPVIGGEEAAYSPQLAVIHTGAALQVTPVATRHAKYVVLDVHSRVCRLDEPSSSDPPRTPVPRSARDVTNALDRPHLAVHRLSTTLRVPVNRQMLIGGMTFDDEADAGAASLYLFVEVNVQELRDDIAAAEIEVD